MDAAIYEVGVDGELDSTNVIPKPIVTGITTLGIDHVVTSGDTIKQIAWHKAGIFRKGSATFSAEQLPDAAKVVTSRRGYPSCVVGSQVVTKCRLSMEKHISCHYPRPGNPRILRPKSHRTK